MNEVNSTSSMPLLIFSGSVIAGADADSDGVGPLIGGVL
jgi:hypothetical protein